MSELGAEALVLLSGHNMFSHAWSLRESEASEFVPLAAGDSKVAFLVAGARFSGAGVRFSGNGVFPVKLEGEVKEAVTLGRMYEGME